MNWIKKELDKKQVKDLASRYKLDMLSAAIFVRRGICRPDELLFYLEDDTRFLHNPFYFKDMPKVIERIAQAIAAGEKIFIYGDRDVDGITSTVLIVDCLHSMGALVEWNVPLGDDDYGLSFSDIDNVHKQGGTLLITVDCGISNHKEVEYASEKNIQTIIIDHHNPPKKIPKAYAVINPKLPDSGYPFRDLSGCGVVFKVDWALHFSHTELFNSTYCLLHVKPGHEAYSIEGIKLQNFIEVDRFRENIVPGVVSLEKSKLAEFIADAQVFIFNQAEHEKLLAKAFPGAKESVAGVDFHPLLVKLFPEFNNKSLLTIRETSRLVRYQKNPLSEIDLFRDLFGFVMLKNIEPALDKCLKRLDLVALGTIADMMPLLNENRIIVKNGLRLINTFGRQGLRELFFKKKLHGKNISTRDIAWQISPLINASGRLGEPDKAIELLLTSVENEKNTLADYLFTLNKKRKSLSDAVWDKISREAYNCYEQTEGKGVLIVSRSVPRGITGIIASRLVNHFKVPAVIITQLEEKAVGSMRSIPAFKLQEFLHQFRDLFSDYGGHDFAAGFSMPLERVDSFKDRYFKVTQKLVLPETSDEKLVIDAEIPCRYLKPELFNMLDLFKPFGEAHPALLLLSRGLTVESCEVVGKKEQVHLKLLLNTGSHKFPAMLWNGVDLYKTRFNIHDKVDIIYRLRVNFYMNTEILQLIVQDIYRHNEKQILSA
ncbi:MAG: single-stranded-DNA-specific exonuclease RecJ [Spirochaetales bacterium]|nr:single-stranded-DNA-specific exonuclease RecJ [Spirochaetales bacterium]